MDFFHRFTSYFTRLIPIFVMAALTLFSFVLMKQGAKRIQSDIEIAPPQTDHDYYLHFFTVSQFDKLGKIKSFFTGDSALHFETAQFMDIKKFTFFSVNDSFQYNGISSTARVTDDGNDAKLYTQAKIERTAPKLSPLITTFQSEYFHFTQSPDTVDSNLPVQIHRDKDVVTANALQYDSDERKLLLTGRVKIRVEPKKN